MDAFDLLDSLLTLPGLMIYVFPTLIARFTIGSHHFLRFAIANLLLGWTIIGWFFLLYRAISGQPLAFGRAAEPASPTVERRWEPEEKTTDRMVASGERPSEVQRDLMEALERRGRAELFDEPSGVRISVALDDLGHRIEVPVANLDPRRGQRHRARQAIQDAQWRQAETGDGIDPSTGLDDEAASWGWTVAHGSAQQAASAAEKLLSTILDRPIDSGARVVESRLA